MRTAQNILNIRIVVKLPYSLTVGCLLGASVSRYMLPYIYWPIKDRYLLGGVINGFNDRLEVDSEGLNIIGVTYGLSLQYFPQRHIGQGFFIRSDVGPAFMAVTSDDDTVDETSDLGLGGLVGAGWSQPITSGTRLTFQVNGSLRQVEGDSWRALSFTLGGLF